MFVFSSFYKPNHNKEIRGNFAALYKKASTGFQFSLEVAQTGGDIQQELLTLVAGAVKGGERERVSWKSKVTNRRPHQREGELDCQRQAELRGNA